MYSSRVRQQMMDVGHAARDRVLDRDHGIGDVALLHRRQRILERRAGHRPRSSGNASVQARCELAPGSP